MSFKKPNKLQVIKIKPQQVTYEWNEYGEFVKVMKDYQKEINLYKGQDLKSMVLKNIAPITDKKPLYIDTTIFKDMDLAKLNDVIDTDIVIDNDNYEIQNTNAINENSNNNNIKTDSMTGEKGNPTGETVNSTTREKL